MFDIGWSEMMIIALVALVVIGPKELPGALKTFAQWMKQARKLAREFQSGIDDMVREAELDDAKKALQSARGMNIGREIERTVDPTGELKKALEEDSPPARTPSIPVSSTPSSTTSDSAEKPAAGSAGSPESTPAATTPQTQT